MTPKAVDMCIKSYIESKEQEVKLIEYTAWLNGAYTMNAIMSSIGNSGWFKKSSAPAHKYPDNPLAIEKKAINENTEANEILAAAEWGKYASILRKKGLQETAIKL